MENQPGQPTGMEYCIVYLSTARPLLDENELTQLLHQWQGKNRALGITGVLLYFHGNILQLLEGSQQGVDELYNVICKDSRHDQVTRLCRIPIKERAFADWAMGYRTFSGTHLDHLGDLVCFNTEDEQNMIRRLVQLFYQTHYRI
jgi:hypothetical protein